MAEDSLIPGGEPARAIVAEVRTLFLSRLGKSLTGAGIRSASAAEAMRSGAGSFFDDMVERGGRPGFEAAAGLTASKIQLVDEVQFELSLRLDEMSRQLFDQAAAALSKLHPRFITLLGRLDMPEGDLPVGAYCVRAGVEALLGELGGSLDQSVAAIGALSEQFSRDLPVVYAELNELLANRDIRPTRLAQAQVDTGGPGARKRPGERRDDPLNSLQQVVFDSWQTPAMAGAGGNVGAGGSAGAAGGMIPAPPGWLAGGAVDAVAAAANAALLEKLLAVLDARQEQATLDLFPDAQARTDQLQELKSGELASGMRGQDAACLDVLSRLFDAIFNDPRLPDAVKSAIARLQIPLLKVAILDQALFSDRQHPARMLLDTMAMAAAGLAPGTSGDHPVCAEILRIAIAVQAQFKNDVEIFARFATELETFVARRDHDLLEAAQPYLSLAKSQEAREVALVEAHRLVRSRDVAQAPRPIADFIDRDWRQVLALAWVLGGEGGKEWTDARAVMEDLLWSVQTKADNGDRARLATMVPGLLRRLNDGLHRVGIAPQDRAAFFDACFTLQTAALRGQAGSGERGPSAGRVGDDVETVESSVDGVILKVIRLSEPASAGADALVSSLQVGDWVDFRLADNELACGCLAWVGPTVGLCLFINPDWHYAVGIMPAILEKQLAVGEASMRDAHSLFDGAADRALRTYSRQD